MKTTILAGAAFAVATATAGSASAYTSFPSWGWLQRWDNSCLIAGNQAGNGIQSTAVNWCSNNINELFSFNPNSGVLWTYNALCVDDFAGSCNQGWTLIGNNCGGSVNQQFFWDGSGYMRSDANWCAIDCPDNSGSNFNCVASGSPQYPSMPAAPPVNPNPNDDGYIPYTISAYSPAQIGLVMGVVGGRVNNNRNGTQVQIETQGYDTVAENWWYDPNTKEIHLTDSQNKCLDVTAFGTANGTPVQIWDCLGGTNQQWNYVTSQGGYAGNFVDTNSGRCLDVPGQSRNPGITLQIWDCWGGLNQSWDGPHAAGGPQRGGN